jgi:hypothetical protein
MSAYPMYKYLISKYLDPIFAVAVGISAAMVRIRREELQKGRDASQAWSVLKRFISFFQTFHT